MDISLTSKASAVGGTDYNIGMNIPNGDAVMYGTSCGLDQICIQRNCVDVSDLFVTSCTEEMRTHNRICNKHNFHCDYGYSLPLCFKSGYRGSIDSGPPLGNK